MPSTAIFNHLLNYNFDIQDNNVLDSADPNSNNNSANINMINRSKIGNSLLIIFEVYTIGFMDRHFLKGTWLIIYYYICILIIYLYLL